MGVLYERYHTREMAELGGLWKRLPLLAFFLILSSLGSAAVPGLNGFVGEFPILAGMFDRSPRAGRAGGHRHDPGGVLPALDAPARPLRPAPRAARHGHGHGSRRRTTITAARRRSGPVGWHEIAGLTPLMVLIVAIGVYPRPFLDRIRPAVAAIAARFEDGANLLEDRRADPAQESSDASAGRGARGRGSGRRTRRLRPDPERSRAPQAAAAGPNEVAAGLPRPFIDRSSRTHATKGRR